MEKFKEKELENIDFSTKRKLLVKSKGILDGKKFYAKEIFAGAMVVLTLLPAFFGGCSKDMPQTSGQTSVPVPTPSASTSYIPTETPGETPTFSIAPEPSVTPTLTVTPIQMSEADEIVQASKDMCDQLYLFSESGNRYTDQLGKFTTELALLGHGKLPQSFVDDEALYNIVPGRATVFLALHTPISGGYELKGFAETDPVFDTIVEAFANEDDRLLFDYFISRGATICLSDGSDVNKAAQEFFDGMCEIYIDKAPVEVNNNKKIEFSSTTPMCQYFLNFYLNCMGTLLEKKTADGTIELIQQDNSNLKAIIKATDDLQIKYGGNFIQDIKKFEVCPASLFEEISGKMAALDPSQYQKTKTY